MGNEKVVKFFSYLPDKHKKGDFTKGLLFLFQILTAPKESGPDKS